MLPLWRHPHVDTHSLLHTILLINTFSFDIHTLHSLAFISLLAFLTFLTFPYLGSTARPTTYTFASGQFRCYDLEGMPNERKIIQT